MPLYESTFIARQDISAHQVEDLAEGFTKIVSDNGGEVKRQEYWGLRSLAYRIKKNRKGHYMMFYLDAPSAAISEMERVMRLHEDVLRYLTLRIKAFDLEPSVIMQVRMAREGSRRGSVKNKIYNRDSTREVSRGNLEGDNKTTVVTESKEVTNGNVEKDAIE